MLVHFVHQPGECTVFGLSTDTKETPADCTGFGFVEIDTGQLYYCDGVAWNPVGGGGPGATAWGDITGTLSDQTDLQSALDAKQATLVSATNIKTINGASVLGSGDLSVSAGDPSYSPGSFTVADETYKLLGKRINLTTTQRATIAGTGRLRVSN